MPVLEIFGGNLLRLAKRARLETRASRISQARKIASSVADSSNQHHLVLVCQ